MPLERARQRLQISDSSEIEEESVAWSSSSPEMLPSKSPEENLEILVCLGQRSSHFGALAMAYFRKIEKSETA